MEKMISARVELDDYANRVLGIIKIKFGLRDKSEALNKFIELYGEEIMEKEASEEYTKKSGSVLTRNLICKKILPKAIFVASDIMAAGVLQCLYEHKIEVPKKVSLTSMDNTLAPYLSPPIPSVDLMYHEIAKKAVAVLAGKGDASDFLTDIKPVLVCHKD